MTTYKEIHTAGYSTQNIHTKRSIPLDTLHKTYDYIQRDSYCWILHTKHMTAYSILSPILLMTLHNIWNTTYSEKFYTAEDTTQVERRLTYTHIDYKTRREICFTSSLSGARVKWCM